MSAVGADRGHGTADYSHVGLLRWAGELQQAALRHDGSSVRAQLTELRDALTAHAAQEAESFEGLSPAAGAAVSSGQRRLLAQIALLLETSTRGGEECRCIEGTTRLIAALRRQARLEAGLRNR